MVIWCRAIYLLVHPHFPFQTRILVTHGLTYLPHVDRVFVISDGRITESGTYQELISYNGPFAEFVRTFLQEAKEEGIVESDGRGHIPDDIMTWKCFLHYCSI